MCHVCYRELAAAAASTLQELLCGRWSSAKNTSGSVTTGAGGGSAAAGDSGSVGGYSCTDDMEAYSQVSSTRYRLHANILQCRKQLLHDHMPPDHSAVVACCIVT
jgi:hypothetical protein